MAEKDTALGRWAKNLLSRVHQNVAVVAFANKLARIAWAVLRRGETFAVREVPRKQLVGVGRSATDVCGWWK